MEWLTILWKTKTGFGALLVGVAYFIGTTLPEQGIAVWPWLEHAADWIIGPGIAYFGVGVRDALRKIADSVGD